MENLSLSLSTCYSQTKKKATQRKRELSTEREREKAVSAAPECVSRVLLYAYKVSFFKKSFSTVFVSRFFQEFLSFCVNRFFLHNNQPTKKQNKLSSKHQTDNNNKERDKTIHCEREKREKRRDYDDDEVCGLSFVDASNSLGNDCVCFRAKRRYKYDEKM